jgi:hypothetical protein
MNQFALISFKILAICVFTSIIVSVISNIVSLIIGSVYINAECEYNLALWLIITSSISVIQNLTIGQLRINIPLKYSHIPEVEIPPKADKQFVAIILSVVYGLCILIGSIWVFTSTQCNETLYNFAFGYIIGTYVYWTITVSTIGVIYATMKYYNIS